MKESIIFKPIGIIHSLFTTVENMPIQSRSAEGIDGSVEIFDEYQAGLQDLDGFSHIILIYYFHKSNGFKLKASPFLEDVEHGVFAIRAPRRPNPIGISIVKLKSIDNGILSVENIDILDGTPLLDIKPYVPSFDSYPEAVTGWLTPHSEKVKSGVSDERFK